MRAEPGTLGPAEGELLGRELSLHRLNAPAVKAPRSAVGGVGVDADTIERAARRSGRSRLPVIGADLDDVAGVVRPNDLLLLTRPTGSV